MKLIATQDAVGHVLCHDMTQIIPGEYKGARFRKGHIVTEEDIPVLLSMGKENLYVWEKTEGILKDALGPRLLTVRVNTTKITAEALKKRLEAEGVRAVPHGHVGDALVSGVAQRLFPSDVEPSKTSNKND